MVWTRWWRREHYQASNVLRRDVDGRPTALVVLRRQRRKGSNVYAKWHDGMSANFCHRIDGVIQFYMV